MRGEGHRNSFPSHRLCDVMDVSPRGLRAFRNRPASHRQRSDLVTLAHIKEQSPLSLGSYGRPRVTEELKEIDLDGGDHKFNIAPNLLDRDFAAEKPNQKWAVDISYVWPREGWLYLSVILELHSQRCPIA